MNGTEEEEGGIIAQAPGDVNHEKCATIVQWTEGGHVVTRRANRPSAYLDLGAT